MATASSRPSLEALALLSLLGCQRPAAPKDSPAPVDSAPAATPGVVVLAGGGSEGELDDAEAWSARLYGALLEGGDVSGDGLLRVAVLSAEEETDWIPRYLERLGADEAFNLRVARRDTAAEVAAQLDEVDAVFLKGGDQGVYYDRWNSTGLDDAIVALHARGGGVGGTSAGAMSLAGLALAGGQDLVSQDVLEDAHTPYLDDASDGGSALHDDFIGLVPGALVDTHFTERGRLGRLAGAMARAVDEGQVTELLGIGLEQRTGLILRGAEAEVVGEGAVTLLIANGAPLREPGRGLIWVDLPLHQLTEGFRVDLESIEITETPPDAETISPAAVRGPAEPGWRADGGAPEDAEAFQWVVEAEPFALRTGERPPLLPGCLALLDAQDRDRRGLAQELLFAGLYEEPGACGFLLGAQTALLADADGRLGVTASAQAPTRMDSVLLVESAGATLRARSPYVSHEDPGDGSLHAAALVDLRLHVFGWSDASGLRWDPEGLGAPDAD